MLRRGGGVTSGARHPAQMRMRLSGAHLRRMRN